MPGKHSKKPGAPSGEPARSPTASGASTADLRAQMAILAEQVRRLGDRVGPVAETEPGAVKPSAHSDPPTPERSHVVSVPRTPAPPMPVVPRGTTLPAAPASPPPSPGAPAPFAERAGALMAGVTQAPFAERASALMAGVIRAAERAADAIRESAEREAARIGERATSERSPTDSPPTDSLPAGRSGADPPAATLPPLDLASPESGLELLNRQRERLAELAAETRRIEEAAARLTAQARALDAERQRLSETIAAARRER